MKKKKKALRKEDEAGSHKVLRKSVDNAKRIGINRLEALALRFSIAALLPYAPDFMIANVFEAT